MKRKIQTRIRYPPGHVSQRPTSWLWFFCSSRPSAFWSDRLHTLNQVKSSTVRRWSLIAQSHSPLVDHTPHPGPLARQYSTVQHRSLQMSTLPPDYRKGVSRASENTVNMTVSQSAKAKPASKASNGKPKTKTQMHRRSRTGMFTHSHGSARPKNLS